jgi:hypothetical protein
MTTAITKDSYIETVSTSNLNLNNVKSLDEYIEKGVEKKINQLIEIDFKSLDNKIGEIKYKPIYNYTINELYKGVIQTIIDIINDISALISDMDYISTQVYRERLINIFLKDDRKIFIGIILVVVSFILYFIDGASI